MAWTPIGSQTGIVSSRDREIAAHPEGTTAWTNRATTLNALVGNDKDHETRLKSIETALASRPF